MKLGSTASLDLNFRTNILSLLSASVIYWWKITRMNHLQLKKKFDEKL